MDTRKDRRNITRFYPIPETWTKYETTFETMESGCKGLSLYLPHTFVANPGTVWVDDISITKISRVGDYHQDFEGETKGIRFRNAEHVRAAGEARTGQGSLRAYFGEKNGGIPVTFSFDMEPSTVYKLELWARSDNGCGIGVGIMNNWEDEKNIARFYPIPKTWKKYEAMFVPNKSGAKIMSLYLPHTYLANPGTVWVDDISITKISSFEGVGDYHQDFEGDAQGIMLSDAEHVRVAGEARTGQGALRAYFGEKNGGIPVLFSFDMDSIAVYKLELWARSDNGCGIGVGVMNTWEDEKNIARFYPIPKTWKKYEAMFVPNKSGAKIMSLYLPHTYLANPGTVWVDDIRITKISSFEGEEVSSHDGYAEDVALVATGSRSAMVAWIDHTPKIHILDGADVGQDVRGVMGLRVAPDKDRLVVREYRDGVWDDREILAEGWLMNPAVSSDGIGDTCVAWSERGEDDRWRMLIRHRRDGAWGEVERLPETGRNQSFPALAPIPISKFIPKWWSRSGRGFLAAWSSMIEGTWSVHAAFLRNTGVEDIVLLSEGGRSGYRPAVAVTSSGRCWVVWQEFDGSDYRIVGRYADPDGAWSGTLVLADSPDDEGHPVLVTDPDDPNTVWLAYDVGFVPKGGQPAWGLRTAVRQRLRVQIRRIVGSLVAPVTVPYETIECDRGERPSIVVKSDGGLWLFERAMSTAPGHWNLRLRHRAPGGTWSASSFPSGGNLGTWLPAAVAELDGGILAVWQTDWRRGDREVKHDDDARSTLVAQYLPGEPAISMSFFKKIKQIIAKYLFGVSSPWHIEGNGIEAEIVAAADPQPSETLPNNIVYEDRVYRTFWGDLHMHSRQSLCAGDSDLDPFDTYVYTRDYEKIDFMALTDHGAHMNHADWFNTMKLASLLNAPGYFIAFLAQEWSSARAYHPDGVGHRNLIYPVADAPRWFHPHFGMMPEELYEHLANQGTPAILLPHQIADGDSGAWTDWSHSDSEWEPLAEIFQLRGSYEYLGAPWMSAAALGNPGSFYQDILSRGRQVGVIASSDHGGGHGKVAVFAESLGRQPIFEAMKARRTYGTSNARMSLDFRVNGELMGGETRDSGNQRKIVLRVQSIQPLREVVVFKNQRKLFEQTDIDTDTFETSFIDNESENSVDWYYLRAIQEDGHLAWSSPVWVKDGTGK